jgi:hypothetical protein
MSSHVIKSEGSSEILPHAFLAAVLCTTKGLRLFVRTIVEGVVAPFPLLAGSAGRPLSMACSTAISYF